MSQVVMFPGKAGKQSKEKKRGGGGGGAPPGERDALEKAVEEKNREFALILMGGRAFVLREFQHPTLNVPTQAFLTTAAFKDWLAPERFFDPETERFTGLGNMWIKNKGRRWYYGVSFNPEGAPENWYNLWKGFSVEAAPPCEDFRRHADHFPTLYDHVLNNIARGDKVLARWVWGWCAHMIQRPTERLGVALVLRGKMGVGKSALGDAIGSLLGPHYTLVDDPKHLVGSFNGHMASTLLLQADEAVWAGDKEAAGRLKSLVTSTISILERKGVDGETMRNLIRLMMTSNEDWVVPAGMEERRFAVIDVGEGRMQDREYFGRMFAELASGGRAHLLAYLKAFPLDKVDLAALPRTEALFEQKVANFEPHVDWWYECLRRGAVLIGQKKWLDEVPVAAFHESYLAFAKRQNIRRPLTNATLGQKIRKLIPIQFGFAPGKIWVEAPEYGPNGELIHNSDGKVTKERVNGYFMPGLIACRNHFAALVRHDAIDWGDGEISAPAKE